MIQQQLRTVRLNPVQSEDEPPTEGADVLIAAIGTFRRVVPGRSVRETLEAAGIALPAAHQTLRINNEQVYDLKRTLQPGDKLTIVNRVVGG